MKMMVMTLLMLIFNRVSDSTLTTLLQKRRQYRWGKINNITNRLGRNLPTINGLYTVMLDNGTELILYYDTVIKSWQLEDLVIGFEGSVFCKDKDAIDDGKRNYKNRNIKYWELYVPVSSYR